MERTTIYAFLTGLFLGRFTNFTSNVIITGVTIYFLEPNFYSYQNLNSIKQTTLNLIRSV